LVIAKIEKFYREMMSIGQSAYVNALNGEDPEMMKVQQLRKADDKAAAAIDAARAARDVAKEALAVTDVRAAEELERAAVALATVIESEMNRRRRSHRRPRSPSRRGRR
jgi:hypothetical protein